MRLPPATPNPCNDCPWRREALPGWLGPHTAEGWVQQAHAEGPIACHQTIKRTDEDGYGMWDDPAMRQCAGAAIFRANICKSPRDPEVAVGERDTDKVFAWDDEFIHHHDVQARRRARTKETSERHRGRQG